MRYPTEYRNLEAWEQGTVEEVKLLASALADTIQVMAPGREQATALTKLDEAVMWATKAVTR